MMRATCVRVSNGAGGTQRWTSSGWTRVIGRFPTISLAGTPSMRSPAGLTYSTVKSALLTAIASAECSTRSLNRRSASAMPVMFVAIASEHSRPPIVQCVISTLTSRISPDFVQWRPARAYGTVAFGPPHACSNAGWSSGGRRSRSVICSSSSRVQPYSFTTASLTSSSRRVSRSKTHIGRGFISNNTR